ncbi:MAG: hypothetical protein C3F13_02730 [Anaerolineales bacterium]|nr:MAG: hypothetical protein C3F13_02730 [Anaerolineales bacterium]
MTQDMFEYSPHENGPDGKQINIGDSPIPGITLRQVLSEHSSPITCIAISPNGNYIASTANDNAIRIWDIRRGKCMSILKGHEAEILSISWAPDNSQLVSGAKDRTIKRWDINNQNQLKMISSLPQNVKSISWSPDSQYIAYCFSHNDPYIYLWATESNKINILKTNKEENGGVLQIAWSPDGKQISASVNNNVYLCDIRTRKVVQIIKELNKNTNIPSLAWSPDGHTLAIGSTSNNISLWDVKNNQMTKILEGLTQAIRSISYSFDGRLLFLVDGNHTLRIWRTDTWEISAIFAQEITSLSTGFGENYSQKHLIATIGKNKLIRFWDLDMSILLSKKATTHSLQYTTAKLVLVGDTGVGKTGVGWWLSHGEYKEQISSHGQQFWIINRLNTKRNDDTECEAVLWDLAGQHVYRQIHSIFLDNVNVSLIVFDPSNRQDPLKGAQYWLEQLKGKKRLPPSILIGARVDRGAPILSQQDLEQFCQRYGISGGYISTSALTGEGMESLLEIIKIQIPWEQMISTVTTFTFKRIKDYILSLKESDDSKKVLVRFSDLILQLHAIDNDISFTTAEIRTAIEHLETHGYVTNLHNAVGVEYILLAPDLLVNIASSVILLADKNPRELGAINEMELLQGNYQVDEIKGLPKDEEQTLIDAVVQRFLDHDICFREKLGNDSLLIFPALIKQKRPLKDEFDYVDDVLFIVRGRTENIYASLVVLLGYTTAFTRINQWQNQAQYEMGASEICGFRLIDEKEGEIELLLYYSTTMPTYGRALFQGLFEKFLFNHDVEVIRIPPVFCPQLHQIGHSLIIKHLHGGNKFLFCDECGAKTFLPEIDTPQTLGAKVGRRVQREESLVKLRRIYEMNLAKIKSFRIDRVPPRCYISHANDQLDWVENLIHDLLEAGIFVLEDLDQIHGNDYILMVCTPDYKKMWVEKKEIDIKTEIKKNHERPKQNQVSVIPLLLKGNLRTSIPVEMTDIRYGDFSDETSYAVTLFDLVLSLYSIQLEHERFKPLRDVLKHQLIDTFGKMKKAEVFLSYAWGDENEIIVNELDQEFQKRNINIIRDKRDLGFKGDINKFMKNIGRGNAIILVISDKYLKSPNCCFELVQIAENGKFADRIFPIILNDAKIYDPIDRAQYVEYWEKKKHELDEVMKRVSSDNMQGFREDIDLYTKIRIMLPELMNILKTMNTLTASLHQTSGFSEILEAVITKLDEE